MKANRERHTVVIALDVRMPFEALLLNRFAALPRERRQAWLRELLVNGFRQYCAGLRVVQQGLDRPGLAGTGAVRQLRQRTQQSPLPQVTCAHGQKPFAALRHVLG